MHLQESKIAVIGLGYVGLPLAIEFSKKFAVIGFDNNQNRVEELQAGKDSTQEVDSKEFGQSLNIKFTCQAFDIHKANIFIVTVPTPIDNQNQPDLSFLRSASETVGKALSKGNIVIFESTVYPGATEEFCIPIIEEVSGLVLNQDFFAGYSPERINPGDKNHKLPDILKVTSGSNEETATFIDSLYRSIITAGTHKAPSIKVAEAAKVIENTQRDINIALINELAIIFNKLGIDTLDVLEAASTKWNFLPFKPGLVGGHCIGVDPYYLTHKAQALSYYPEIILAGRRLNDSMSKHVVFQLIKSMIKNKINVEGSKVLIMGFTFKENCPDIRNTKVVDIVFNLKEFGIDVDVYDPWCSKEQCSAEYDIEVLDDVLPNTYDSIILAVSHDIFQEIGIKAIRSYGKENHILYDLKYLFDKSLVDLRL